MHGPCSRNTIRHSTSEEAENSTVSATDSVTISVTELTSLVETTVQRALSNTNNINSQPNSLGSGILNLEHDTEILDNEVNDKDVRDVIKGVRERIPPFDGRGSPAKMFEFLKKLNHYFKLVKLTEKHKIAITIAHFEQTANTWYNMECSRNPPGTMNELITRMHCRFIPINYEDHILFRLKNLKQLDKSVTHYNDIFLSLTDQLVDMRQREKLSYFISGLNWKISNDITSSIENTRTYEAALQSALRRERIIIEQRRPQNEQNNNSRIRSLPNTLSTMNSRNSQLNYNGRNRHWQNENPRISANMVGRQHRFDHSRNRCTLCNEYGHSSRYCSRVTDFITSQESRNSSEKPHAMFSKARNIIDKDDSTYTEFLIDSGCSQHMTPHRNILTDLKPHVVKVTVANNSTIESTHIGNFYTKIGDTDIVLTDVLLIPKLSRSLLSVHAATKHGFTFQFMRNRQLVISHPTIPSTKVQFSCDGYQINFPEFGKLISMNIAKQDYKTIHENLGHPGKTKTQQILANTGQQAIIPKNFICECCMKGRATRNPFKTSHSKTNTCLQLVHSDVMGPFKANDLYQTKFVLTFIDDFTRYSQVFLLRSKTATEVLSSFKTFLAWSQTKTGQKLKRFRSDNGTEYTLVDKHCQELGIELEKTVKNSPQSNGVSERHNRTLFDKLRTLLYDSNLPLQCWSELFRTSVFIFNRLPNSYTRKTPFIEFSEGTKPKIEYDFFKRIGSKAYVKITDPQSKFASRIRVGCLVGYTTQSKAYQIYIPESNSFEESRDITFDTTITCPDDIKLHMNKDDIDYFDYDLISQIADDVIDNEEEYLVSEILAESGHGKNKRYLVRWQNTAFGETWEPLKNLENNEQLQIFKNRTNAKKTKDYAFIIHPNIPQTIKEILNGNEIQEWFDAMQDELNSMAENMVWEECTRPTDKNIISCRWVFAKKNDEFGNPVRYRARLVARGFTQEHLIDYDEIFAPTITKDSLRLILAIAAAKNLHMRQYDVKTAFLYGDIDTDVVMEFPDTIERGIDFTKEKKITYQEYKNNSRKCVKLLKGIYGLKQASRLWYKRLSDFLIMKMKFKRSDYDSCLFIKHDKNNELEALLSIYVDDFLLCTRKTEDIAIFTKIISSEFKISDCGTPRLLLGMHIRNELEGIYLDQRLYIRNLLQKYRHTDCNPAMTPMHLNFENLLSENSSPVPVKEFQALIGSFIYLVVCTRLDLSVSVNLLSRVTHCPKKHHLQAAYQILRYLKNTQNKGLFFPKTNNQINIEAYSDSNWANDRSDGKSTTGQIILFNNTPIHWRSFKQKTVATSSVHAEYNALASVGTELLWLSNVLHEILGIKIKKIPVYIDNSGAQTLATHGNYTRQTKHIDTKHHYLTELSERNIIKITHVATTENIADLLTKPLGFEKFNYLNSKYNLLNSREGVE
ncbi:unnamed protein product [Rotaria magnacalcarata]|uniref:Uncharacterized protein n=1 Tax=Rotaria magnacalcarata TaxID=392030 RepID=A0A816SQS0_9BILA|nr:unnamed protein product [Rotaria magnacalcarata]CAF4131360.1 unnamed protein product [Rotaria magnacalcarata]